MRMLTPPIFCDHCSCLALAVIDGEIVCTACLLARVRVGEPAVEIRPLPLVTTGLAHLGGHLVSTDAYAGRADLPVQLHATVPTTAFEAR